MGKLVEMMKKRHLVILEKPSGAIAIVGDMNALQRKLYDVFLFEAKDELKNDIKKDYFKISLSEIIGALELEKPNKQRLKQMIRDLVDIKIEYNYLRKDGETWGISSVLNDVKVDFDKEIGKTVINYSLPRIVREAMVKKNGVFAKIDLVVVKGLKSKYAILLYELIKDYERVEVPEMSIQDFRKMFGVKDKYPRMPDLRKYVLDPACKEISENPHTDFTVSYELKKEGKAYTSIKFHVKPKPARVKLDQQAKKVLEAEVKENDKAKELLALIPSEYRRRNRVVSLVLGSLKENGKEYTKAQIEYAVNKLKAGKIKSFSAYLKKAIEKDYASFEEIEDIGFVTPEDAVGYRLNVTYKGKDMYVEIAHIEIKENLEQQGIGYDKERVYLVRFDNVKTGEVAFWYEFGEEKLFEWARKNIELRKKRRES